MQSFVNDMLDLRALKAGHFTLAIESFDVFALVSQVFSIFRPQAKNKDVELRAAVQGKVIEEELDPA